MADFIPHKDSEFGPWAANFSTKITATPTAYGLIAGDATALATAVTNFTAALTTATNPATRTPVTVASKDTLKAVLIADIRSLAKRIQATPAVTASQKTELGLPVHDAVPTPVAVPTTKPTLDLRGIDRQSHLILIADETTPLKRAKPPGVIGCEIYAAVGPTPPTDLRHWEYMGLASKAEFTLSYEPEDVNKQATIVARWINRKGEVGPVSNPITGSIAA